MVDKALFARGLAEIRDAVARIREVLPAELQRQRVVDWNSRPFAERAQAWREHLEAVQHVNEARRRSSSEFRKALDLYRHEILDNLQIDPDTLRAR